MSSKGRGRSSHLMTTSGGRSWKILRSGCGRGMKSGACACLSSDSTFRPPRAALKEMGAWPGAGNGHLFPLHTHSQFHTSSLQVATKGLSGMLTPWCRPGCCQLPSMETCRRVG